jgi:hypothetical protein
MGEIVFIIVIAALIWYWWDSIWCKEIARSAGRRRCDQADVQFLDDTVERKKIWLQRNEQGNLQFRRLYHFEFTLMGEKRYLGHIDMLGKRVINIEMEPYRISLDVDQH